MPATPENSHSNSTEAFGARIAQVNAILIGEGGGAPDPVRATRQFLALAQQKVGAAAERLAVLAAAGVARPPDWPEAMNWLVRAAELGHAPSQGQLAVFAGVDNLLPPGTDWREFAGRIDLRSMLRAPSLHEVRAEPSIALLKGLATPQICRWLIARGESRLAPAMVSDSVTGQWVLDPVRSGLAAPFGLATKDMVLVLTQKRLELASGLAILQQEAPHVLSYEVRQEYKAHYDFLPPGDPSFAHVLEAMGQRVATCLTWLNDDYDGGETAFLKLGWQHKGKPGDAMLFLNVRRTDKRPDPMTLHAGLSVTRGRKWLLSQWVRDRVQPIV
jgi:hypothetical protein